MKKKKFSAILLLALVISVSVFMSALSYRVSAASSWDVTVQQGKLDKNVPFATGQGNWGDGTRFGSLLIPDETKGKNRGEYELVVAGGWGHRFTFTYGFDLSDFEMELDLSNINIDANLGLIFSATPGGYYGGSGGGFAIKLYTHETYCGVIVTNTDHATTIPTMSPKPATLAWDSQNTGYTFIPAGGIVNIKLKQIAAGQDYTLLINDNDFYTIPLNEVTKNLGTDLSNIYLSMGGIGDDNLFFRVKKLIDANITAYEAKLPSLIEEIEEYIEKAEGNLTIASAVNEAELLREAIKTDTLRVHDLNYWNSKLKAADNKVLEAKKTLGAKELIDLFDLDIDRLANIAEAASDNEAIAKGDALVKSINTNIIKSIDNIADLGSEQARYETVSAKYTTTLAELEKARKVVVLKYVQSYEEKAEELKSISDINQLTEYKNLIYKNLMKLDADSRSEIASRLVDVQDKVDTLGTLAGWLKGDAVTIFNEGNGYEYTGSKGANSSLETRTGSGLTYGEKFTVNYFEIDLKFLTTSIIANNWFALSLTKENNNFFISENASNEEAMLKMQSNPGIVMMFNLKAGNKLSIEVFMIKATYTTLFSTTRGEMIIDYKMGDELKIKIQAKNDENSTYANIFFNEVKFTGTNIKNSELKGSIGMDLKGYLSLCLGSAGYNVAVTKINGKNASGSDITTISKVVVPDDPKPIETPDPIDTPKEDGKGCGSYTTKSAVLIISFIIGACAIFAVKRRKNQIGDNK